MERQWLGSQYNLGMACISTPVGNRLPRSPAEHCTVLIKHFTPTVYQ